MAKYRKHLPQLGNELFLTDGGMETTLIFHESIDLPHFAGFDLLKNEAGMNTLRTYYERYLAIARRHHVGAVLEAPTWRANPDWATKLGYDSTALADANRKAIGLMLDLRANHETRDRPMVISATSVRAGTATVQTHACQWSRRAITMRSRSIPSPVPTPTWFPPLP